MFGPAGIAVDTYLRSTDEEGFTGWDALSVAGGIGGGAAAFGLDQLPGIEFDGFAPVISQEERAARSTAYWNNVTITTSEGTVPYSEYINQPNAPYVAPGGRLMDWSELGRNAHSTELVQQNNGFSPTPECFPAGTQIQLSNGETAPIEELRAGGNVAAFDGGVFNGRGELVGKQIDRLFELRRQLPN